MNINLTLLGQTISFALFVWFCMKFVWPPIMKALEERKQTIADGLAAAEKGKHDQELAEKHALEVLHEAKSQAAEIVARAEKRGAEIIDEAKADAKVEGQRLVKTAEGEIEQELNRAREELRKQVAALVVAGAEQVLEREIDAKAHSDVVDKLVAQL
jgi:F-type H+-transporting ATPase subunit b